MVISFIVKGLIERYTNIAHHQGCPLYGNFSTLTQGHYFTGKCIHDSQVIPGQGHPVSVAPGFDRTTDRKAGVDGEGFSATICASRLTPICFHTWMFLDNRALVI